MFNKDFYKGKTVLITGHTGFKGSWLTRILVNLGAKVVGYSLESPTNPCLFNEAKLADNITSIIGDIRSFEKLLEVFTQYQPEIVLHLAAQPLVLDSYNDPKYTYETNVMGTVNLMECIRHTLSVKSVLNVTTDKVYKNREWCWGYREDEILDGYDPYSNSKSCSELVTHSYVNSFFNVDIKRNLIVSTARAGNVIGGGDFSKNRIIPDCVRSVESNQELIVRNPNSTRPYQHVLEPLFAYLMIVSRQCEDNSLQGYYNVGPDDKDCVTTEELVELFKSKWNSANSTKFSWCDCSNPNAPHEANFLKLDCSKIKSTFGWKPILSIDDAINLVCEFTRVYLDKKDIVEEMDREITLYMEKFFNV
jgi:CDP-glucose 4,6-dehydratase